MRQIRFIILGTIAVVLIGLVAWQLMWMNDVVNNYEANKSYSVPDLKNNIKDDKFHNKGTNTFIADQSGEEEVGAIPGSPRISKKSEIDKLEKEEQVVSERLSDLDSNEVKRISANEPLLEINSQGSRNSDEDIQNIAPSQNEKVKMGKEDTTISIKIKGNKTSLPLKQVIAESPVSSGKTIKLQSQPVTQHSTSTPPY